MRRYTYLTLFFFGLFIAIFTLNTNTQAHRKTFQKGTDQELSLAKSMSYDYLAKYVTSYGIDSAKDLKVANVFVDELSMAHTKMQQTFNGVPVLGGETIVHLNSDGSLFNITDSLVAKINVNTEAKLSSEEAIAKATSLYGCEGCLTAQPKVDMFVMRHNNKDHLVYRVQLQRIDGSAETAMPVYFIDAHTGKKVSEYNNLQTASATVTGTSTYYGSLSLTGYQSGTSYYLEDVGRKVGTFTFNNGTTSIFRASSTTSSFTTTAQKAMVDAHYGTTKTYDYYKNTYGRNGIDGNGGPAYVTSIDGVTGLISSIVHYSTAYNNAFWNGQYMTFGDGDGSTFTALTSIDICGHELTHGVTERTAGLVYSNQSGALNEAMSDILGSMVERFTLGESSRTWMIGEDAYTPGTAGDALRYLDNTHRGSQPDHMSEYVNTTSDNGGVHTNSGIPNYAFYLLAKGGTHHLGGSMTGIGADAAAAIFYKALTTYMTSSTDFAGARTATLNAAAALYGSTSTQYTAVQNAWGLCGVGSVAGGGGGGTGGTERISNGGFETSVSPWVQSGTGALYVANGNYPQAGTGYIYFGNANSVTGTTYQQITIPAGTSPTLSFYLNVTSAETTTTTAYDKMSVEVRNSAGTLLGTLATYSNLNKVATAGSYSQKSFSLAAYAGQTIRVQFSSTTDSSAITTFRVDTVSVK